MVIFKHFHVAANILTFIELNCFENLAENSCDCQDILISAVNSTHIIKEIVCFSYI